MGGERGGMCVLLHARFANWTSVRRVRFPVRLEAKSGCRWVTRPESEHASPDPFLASRRRKEVSFALCSGGHNGLLPSGSSGVWA